MQLTGSDPNRLIRLFARHPNAANLLMVLMILLGLYGISQINTQTWPSIETDSVRINISWPGASAEDVEANILKVVEPVVRFTDGAREMTSVAREGSGRITLEFNRGTDMPRALSDVESAVAGISTLPVDVETPSVSLAKWFEGVARLAVLGPYSEETLKAAAKRIRDDLVDRGIDRVVFSGLREEEISVTVAERDLQRLGLTVGEISNAISDNSRDLPSGTLDGPLTRQVRALAESQDPLDLRRLEIKAFTTGESVFLGDFAEIDRRFDPDQNEGFSLGAQAIEVQVQRSEAADTLETAAILDAYLEGLRPTLPPDMEIIVYDVRADLVSDRIGLLLKNGLQGLVLVVLILFVFLNGRVAFWVAVGVPVALLATIGVMYLTGQTINMVSLFALIMMLGVIVDDAIVVGEHTATQAALGHNAIDSAVNGAARMLAPVMAASLTTIAAFAPLFLLSETLGRFIQAMPLVVFAVVLASLIECFLILPGHLAHALGVKRRIGWSFWRWVGLCLTAAFVLVLLARDWSAIGGLPAVLSSINEGLLGYSGWALITLLAGLAMLIGGLLEAAAMIAAKRTAGSAGSGGLRRLLDQGFADFRDGPFRWIMQRAFDWRYVTVAIAMSALILTYGLISGGIVGFNYWPSPEAETIRARLQLNAGASKEALVDAVQQVEAALYKAESELSDAPFVVASYATIDQEDNIARFRVQFVTADDRDVRTSDIIKAWRASAPKLADIRRFSIYQLRGGGQRGRDIDLRFSGAEPALLKQAAEAASTVLTAYPGVSGVADDLPYGKPELIIRPNARGAALGLSIDDIGRQVRNALEGAIPRRFADGDEEVAIRVMTVFPEEGSAALRRLSLRTPSGSFVPLQEVAEIAEKQGFSRIQRTNGRAVVSLTADVDELVKSPDAVIDEIIREGQIEAVASQFGVTVDYSGRIEERQTAFADLKIGLAVALAVIYVILAWIFGYYFRPFAVMLIIPFGVVGATFGHWILGYDLTILSLCGLLGLSGILVNDSIILVTRLIERQKHGESLRLAAIGASQDRLRAVLLTSLTTIGGLIPLLFETSFQAQFLLPMVITLVFGLALATLLVLFLVPAFVGIADDIGRLARMLSHRDGSSEDPEQSPGRA